MAIRLVRLFTGDDGESHFTDSRVELGPSDAPSAGSEVDGAAADCCGPSTADRLR